MSNPTGTGVCYWRHVTPPAPSRNPGLATLRVLLAAGLAVAMLTGWLAVKEGQREAAPAWACYRPAAVASWYGTGRFARRYPAYWLVDPVRWPYTMGEFALQAAENTLPLGTIVLVTNLRQPWRRLPVIITDRGKFGPGVSIDLNAEAFEALRWPGCGHATVRLDTLRRRRR